jgi:hypothetical protein
MNYEFLSTRRVINEHVALIILLHDSSLWSLKGRNNNLDVAIAKARIFVLLLTYVDFMFN